MTEPTTGQWRDLHEAFGEYCRLTPWQWLTDSDLIAIEHPSGEYMGYCTVVGSAGREFGLAVFLGDEGLSYLMALMANEIPPQSPDALVRMNALTAILTDRGALDDADRAIIRKLGLKYRGRGKWPLFRNTTPGFEPWRFEADHAVFMTTAIHNVLDVSSRIARGELSAHSEEDASLVLNRVLRDGAWRDEWKPFIPPPPPPPVPAYGEPERLRRLADGKPVGTWVWEVSIFIVPAPVQERRGARPYYTTALLVVDSDSGLVLDMRDAGHAPTEAEQQELLVGLLERVEMAPSEIVTATESTARVAHSIFAPLGIRVWIGETPALDDAQQAMLSFIG